MALFDKFDSKKQDRYLGCLRKGMRRGEAARAAGISRDTVFDYTKANPEFQVQIDQAEADYCDQVEKYLLKAAKKMNMTAIIFWLTNRAPDRWKDRRNNGGNQVPIQNDQVLAEILKRLQGSSGGQ